MGTTRSALLNPPRPSRRRADVDPDAWDVSAGLAADLDPGAWADQARPAEPVWLTDPSCTPARVLAGLEAQDAESGGLRPLAEPEPGPWDDEAFDEDAPVWTGDVAAGRDRDQRSRGGGWRSVCTAGDLAPAGHVPLAAGGQVPAALVELAGADPAGLHPGELVDALAAAEQLKAWADAAQLSALAVLTDWCATLRGVGDGSDQVPAAAMAGAEAGPALGISPRSAAMKVGLAQDLRRLPATMAALRAGRLSLAKARVVSDALIPLSAADAAAVEAQVLESHGHATQAALAAALRRAVIALDPAAAEDRHKRAVKTRGVWRQNIEDGLARLEWLAPADQVATAHAAITTLARAAQTADRAAARAARQAGQPAPDVRTLDQARSDVLADLTGDQLTDLIAGHGALPNHTQPGDTEPDEARRNEADEDDTEPGDREPGDREPGDREAGEAGLGEAARSDAECSNGPADGTRSQTAAAETDDTEASEREPRAEGTVRPNSAPGPDLGGGGRLRPRIDVVVGLATLLGLNDLPAELAGYGPIPASMARRLAAEGTWRRLVTDPTGRVLDYSTRAHDPPPDLAAFVQARDRTCRFPGCRMPAIRCDLDHNVPHPDGDTEAGNLCCLCRTHHRIKTVTDTAVRNDGTGVITWTMPSGKTWTTDPPPTPPDPPHDAHSEDARLEEALSEGAQHRGHTLHPEDVVLTGDPMIDDEPPF